MFPLFRSWSHYDWILNPLILCLVMFISNAGLVNGYFSIMFLGITVFISDIGQIFQICLGVLMMGLGF